MSNKVNDDIREKAYEELLDTIQYSVVQSNGNVRTFDDIEDAKLYVDSLDNEQDETGIDQLSGVMIVARMDGKVVYNSKGNDYWDLITRLENGQMFAEVEAMRVAEESV